MLRNNALFLEIIWQWFYFMPAIFGSTSLEPKLYNITLFLFLVFIILFRQTQGFITDVEAASSQRR